MATITVYGDGRLFVAAPTADHRPGHPVPIERGQVAPDDLVAFVRSVDASGLFTRPDTDFGSPLVTDVPTTRVTFQGDRDRSPVEASVYAFDDEFTDDLTDAQVDRRHALEDLIDEAESLASDTKSWTPDRVRVTDISERDMDTSQVPAPWPGPAFADFLEIPAPDGAGRPCGELSGDAAAAVFAAASENEGIRFEHAGEQRDLVVAPLLPGEKACADL